MIDCPAEEMWADVMTKPLQGTAFRVMRAELMNCDVNYEDPPEGDDLESIPALKTVSWKKDIASYSTAPQECVGQNKNPKACGNVDRYTGNTYTRGARNRQLGVARLRPTTWQVGTAGKRVIRQ